MVYIPGYDRRCRFCDADLRGYDHPFDHHMATHYACSQTECWRAFSSKAALDWHLLESHYFCRKCQRLFESEQNLQAHLRSRAHVVPTYRCPMGECQRKFTSRAALALHLESGACLSDITRTLIDKHILDHPLRDVICNPYSNSSTTSSGPCKPLPVPPCRTGPASDASWTGSGYECVSCQIVFPSRAQLDQHLASPKHARTSELTYRCPDLDCARPATTLSGLCQHIESGVCRVHRYGGIESVLDMIISGMRDLQGLSVPVLQTEDLPVAQVYTILV
ncbi:hypothetical protein CALCODRAFT_242597 [Calocera cornea HHB12733]|uniref:C2H2-type domain-containing protein n=1 Tax=Calocera cornea HHB12733 TaxID=1353952 RepID=A0A165GPT3_9BASI|nr:hypothetical protein CALCODRAFT_242597 [Calocera cornea HHB12733]